jgi:hypothetical protein
MLLLKQVGLFRCFEGTFSLSVAATGTSDYIVIPNDVDRVSVQLQVPSTAVGTIEGTISTQAEIEDGTALWKEWDLGSTTAGTILQDATKGPVAAIRLNVLTALAANTAKVSVRAQRGTP